MDQCNLLQYQIHDQWVENIFDVGTEAPMDGFMSVTMPQVIQTVSKQFLQLAEMTTSHS